MQSDTNKRLTVSDLLVAFFYWAHIAAGISLQGVLWAYIISAEDDALVSNAGEGWRIYKKMRLSIVSIYMYRAGGHESDLKNLLISTDNWPGKS